MDLAFELKKRRRELTLGGALLVVLTVFFYTQSGGGPSGGAGEETVMVTGPPAAVAKAMAKIGSVKLPGVLLERLNDDRVPYDPTQRNIFRYGNLPPPPPSPEELARIEAAKQAAEQARQAAIQAELDAQKNRAAAEAAALNQPPIDPATGLPVGVAPPPPPKPMPPAITLRYSGYLGAERDKMAVLYSGEDMLLARAGDVVERQFRVLDIGYDWVKIGYVDPQFADQYQKLRMGP
ncbi:MAG: hypothetical protein L0191_01810 [Acidobacteria bacterium]|nr:hypothetical protein [Acidobacteriota bacterium]MCI0566563.1 hypothetical protein [Acidobacteriota bacterium]